MRKVFVTLAIVFAVTIPNKNTEARLDFYSDHEAFSTDDSKTRCIGGCEKDNGRNTPMCYVSWHEQKLPCRKEKPLVHRRTDLLDECISDCDDFGYGKEWCAITAAKWGLCSRRTATTGVITFNTHNPHAVCKKTSPCDSAGYSYNWCYTVDNSWAKCDQNDVTIVYDYPTDDNSRCAGKCAPYYGELKCYNTDGAWQRCYINPSSNYTIHEIDVEIKKNCIFMQYDNNDGSQQYCRIGNRRSRRQVTPAPYNHFESSDQRNNELYFDEQCALTVDEIIARQHQGNVPIMIRPNFNPNSNPTTDSNSNPIIRITALQTPSYFREHAQDVILLLNTYAIITRHTILANRNAYRSDFGHLQREHQNGLDKFTDLAENDPKKRNDDEMGHVIASRLGGTPEIYNVFPQPRTHNRGRNIRWTELEHEIEQFVGNNPDRYVEFTAALSYATDSTFNIIHRPTAIVVRARYYENGRLVDPRTFLQIASVDDNPYDNIYFTNDPMCTPLPRDGIVHLHPTRKG